MGRVLPRVGGPRNQGRLARPRSAAASLSGDSPMKQRLVRTLVLIALAALLPASALASRPAHPARATAPPRAGAWTMVPSGAEAGLISGTFTVTASTAVTDIRARAARRSGCTGGAVEVDGTLKISETNFGQGAQWEVGSGRNAGGGAAATPIDLTVGGRRQVDATLTLAFPSAKGIGSSGEINWGAGSGLQPCGFAYTVKPG